MISRLKVLRAEHDMTQADLGAAVGVSRQAINAIETGKFEPSLGLAWRLARHFGQPIEAIFDFTDEWQGD
jgi:putative transcriptional regulator